ncbi:uncharacterized protein CC84DRAFT_655723 [Paraphaeosphaeria sporulosa]|uniref:Uncharacterized protein n=1 Tax=Paraphaeosphaeria sporulosa TaxID=1460663 RepID=A0A177CK77_9PLEO|nr:uncharacterized protein CC84DRAFT_655723 [Paraphaeosphaeria sporulosa]OAG07372.1 hypothetical protein CC84DRAFT_655723 [Paraphaeosphaeria sporulosa]
MTPMAAYAHALESPALRVVWRWPRLSKRFVPNSGIVFFLQLFHHSLLDLTICSQLCMKTISPVVSFFEYTQFLHHFLFTGIPFSVIRICMPLGKWPSEEVDLRPLIVARTVDTNDDPMNSIIELQGGYLERLFSDSAVWKKVLSSGQIRAISFRSERWKAYLTFTISNHLGDEWHQYGHGAVAHECP